MDYKKQIADLRIEASYKREKLSRYMVTGKFKAAANSIETLLAERDAAIEDLRGMCWCCAHGERWDKAPEWSKMTTCEHMRGLGALARSGGKCKCPHWQWRGPQKGEADHGRLALGDGEGGL